MALKKVNYGAKKKSKDTKTLVEVGDFQGKPMFQVWEVNDENENIKNFPLISFGVAKARILLNNLDALKEFVDNH